MMCDLLQIYYKTHNIKKSTKNKLKNNITKVISFSHKILVNKILIKKQFFSILNITHKKSFFEKQKKERFNLSFLLFFLLLHFFSFS